MRRELKKLYKASRLITWPSVIEGLGGEYNAVAVTPIGKQGRHGATTNFPLDKIKMKDSVKYLYKAMWRYAPLQVITQTEGNLLIIAINSGSSSNFVYFEFELDK